MKQINGQFSIFDMAPAKRPCEYSVKRFIGQRVHLQNGKCGTVTGIHKYYTDVLGDDGDDYIGTPYDSYEEAET